MNEVKPTKENKDEREIYKLDVRNGYTQLDFDNWFINFMANGNCDTYSTNPDF